MQMIVPILWEILLRQWPAIGGVLLLLIALNMPVWAEARSIKKKALPAAMLTGVATALVSVPLAPLLTHSNIANVSYLADWLALGSMAAGVGFLAFLLSWPIWIALYARRSVARAER